MEQFVLASRSPRRRVLLSYLLNDFMVHGVPVLEEAPRNLPIEAALETIAAKKAIATSKLHPDAWTLAADTVVTFHGRLLNKPRSRSDARQTLTMLMGQDVGASTGVALARRGRRVDVDAATTNFRIKPLPKDVLDHYMDANVWQDKAGGLALQDAGLAMHVEILAGHWSNAVGLPLQTVHEMLTRNRIPCKAPPDEAWMQDHNPFDAPSS